MRTDEATAVSRLAGLVLSGGTTRISELHAGIAARAFAGVGPAARPVQAVHDTVSSLTYRTVGAALGAGATLVGALASRQVNGRPLEDTPAARVALAILNGAHGDLLGGNGILLENHVMRHLADVEAIHTYEGTETIQTLLVGRDITGVGAFV